MVIGIILIFVILIATGLFIWYSLYKFKESKTNMKNGRDEIARMKKESEASFASMGNVGFSKDCDVCTLKEDDTAVYTWLFNNELWFHSKPVYEEYSKYNFSWTYGYKAFYFSIPINKIRYYQVEGDVSYTTSIHGGGGGGSSLAGALGGGILAGGAGAIIGSRRKNDPIYSVTDTKDGRIITLFYEDQMGEIKIRTFGGDALDIFRKLIPKKDKEFIILSQA